MTAFGLPSYRVLTSYTYIITSGSSGNLLGPELESDTQADFESEFACFASPVVSILPHDCIDIHKKFLARNMGVYSVFGLCVPRSHLNCEHSYHEVPRPLDNFGHCPKQRWRLLV